MAMKTINVNPLRVSSITNAIQQLKDYQAMLQNFPEMYTKALVEFLIETLHEEAPKMDKYFIWDIRDTDKGSEGVIIFDGIVQFVEFGTGLVGETSNDGINTEWLSKLPPPYNEGYQSRKGEIGHHIDSEGQDYWVYQKDGRYWSTYGQKANPFIYRSVQRLLDERKAIAQILLDGMRA